MSWNCNEWENELLYRLQIPSNDDEKYAKGIYDMAIDIAKTIEWKTGRDFDDIDSVIDIIYNAIKYGEEIE